MQFDPAVLMFRVAPGQNPREAYRASKAEAPESKLARALLAEMPSLEEVRPDNGQLVLKDHNARITIWITGRGVLIFAPPGVDVSNCVALISRLTGCRAFDEALNEFQPTPQTSAPAH